MRWLLVKDLQILRRSPLVAALLIAYPIAIAVLIGFALSRGPEDPRVALVSQVPEGSTLTIGGAEIDVVGAGDELCERVECVPVGSEAEARRKVEDGDVLAALILPEDLIERLESLGGLNPRRPTVRVLVNEEDPVKAQLVGDRIDALLADASLRVSTEVADVAVGYLDLLLAGGRFELLGQSLEILGLESTERILTSVRGNLPAGSDRRRELDRVIRFARQASQNLNVAAPLLAAVSEPIAVDEQAVEGDSPSLDAFAISVAAALTLMLVTALLVSGSLALEREENAFGRLTRGLVGRTALLAEKVLLGVVAALVVTILMLVVVAPFVSLDWGRLGLWVVAILAGGAGAAAFGAAIGAAAREVRAASLLAFMISLPIAFLSLVPSGTVSPGLFDVIEVVESIFPFDAARRGIGGALEASGPSIAAAIAHLVALTLAYGLLARLALRRFA